MNIVLPIITAILGLIAGHWLTSKRDLENKKREIRLNYLIEAYRKIERGSMPTAKKYDKGDFESAIADIQMLGKFKQVNIAYEFAVEASKGNNADLQKLLGNIRFELRKELSLNDKNLPKVRPFRIS